MFQLDWQIVHLHTKLPTCAADRICCAINPPDNTSITVIKYSFLDDNGVISHCPEITIYLQVQYSVWHRFYWVQSQPAITLKAPNKNCSRRHFKFLLLSFEENKAWFFMWILCIAEVSLETSSIIFSEKQWKIFMNVVCCSRDWSFKG